MKLHSAKVFILLTILATTLPAWAAETTRHHDLEPVDYFSIAGISTPTLSPDGSRVAWIESRWEKALDRKNNDLWVMNLESRQPQRLTFDPAGESGPVWSGDGRSIYFAAGYERPGAERPPFDGSRQVWKIQATGGEPVALTRVEDGIGLWSLAADNGALYYTVMEEKTEDEWSALRKEHSELNYGHGVGERSRLMKLDLLTWRTQELLETGRVVTAISVSSNGRIAMISTPDEELIHKEGWSRVEVLEPGAEAVQVVTADGWRNDHPSPYGWLDDVAWSGDGSTLAFSISFDGFPTRVYTARWEGDAPRLSDLPRPDGVTVSGGTMRWRNGDLAFIGEEQARSRVYLLEGVGRSGKAEYTTLTTGDVTVNSFDFSGSGDRLVVSSGSLTSADDLYLVVDNGDLERLTHINPQIDEWKLPSISLVQWKGAGGDIVEGILELPPDYKLEDGPIPMVVELHGGPTSATRFEFRFWIYGRALLPARGIAILSPNYRGSTGYGDKFMTDLVGRENDIDVKDILTGVDAMIKRGIADPDRLGVMGWSNGGFLTNCLITTTDRFKAASSGAGVIDQVLQ